MGGVVTDIVGFRSELQSGGMAFWKHGVPPYGPRHSAATGRYISFFSAAPSLVINGVGYNTGNSASTRARSLSMTPWGTGLTKGFGRQAAASRATPNSDGLNFTPGQRPAARRQRLGRRGWSYNGRYVGVPGATRRIWWPATPNNASDIFVYDLQTHSIQRVSVVERRLPGQWPRATRASISAGRPLLSRSTAMPPIWCRATPNGHARYTFNIRDLGPPAPPTAASRSAADGTQGNADSNLAALGQLWRRSAAGRSAASASNLVGGEQQTATPEHLRQRSCRRHPRVPGLEDINAERSRKTRGVRATLPSKDVGTLTDTTHHGPGPR